MRCIPTTERESFWTARPKVLCAIFVLKQRNQVFQLSRNYSSLVPAYSIFNSAECIFSFRKSWLCLHVEDVKSSSSLTGSLLYLRGYSDYGPGSDIALFACVTTIIEPSIHQGIPSISCWCTVAIRKNNLYLISSRRSDTGNREIYMKARREVERLDGILIIRNSRSVGLNLVLDDAVWHELARDGDAPKKEASNSLERC